MKKIKEFLISAISMIGFAFIIGINVYFVLWLIWQVLSVLGSI